MSRGIKHDSQRSPGQLKFSRFEAEVGVERLLFCIYESARGVSENGMADQVAAMQRNSSTYCDAPEDTEDFREWKETFSVEEKEEDIQNLVKENAFMAELHKRIVPVVVENDVFWTRYFYRYTWHDEKE